MRQNKPFLLLVVLPALIFAGCAYNSEFGCKGMPEGTKCVSVSEVYNNSVLNSGIEGSHNNNGAVTAGGTRLQEENIVNKPLRTPPHVIRIWITPWVNGDGDLHDASYMYVEVNPGRWNGDFVRGTVNGGNDSHMNIMPPQGLTNKLTPTSNTDQKQKPVIPDVKRSK